jgi:hypothetical protein
MSHLSGTAGGRHACLDAELSVNMLHVVTDRRRRDPEDEGNLRVALALSDPLEHFGLSPT